MIVGNQHFTKCPSVIENFAFKQRLQASERKGAKLSSKTNSVFHDKDLIGVLIYSEHCSRYHIPLFADKRQYRYTCTLMLHIKLSARDIYNFHRV